MVQLMKCKKKRLEKDEVKNDWMSRNNKKLIRIWESDARDNEELVLELLKPLF